MTQTDPASNPTAPVAAFLLSIVPTITEKLQSTGDGWALVTGGPCATWERQDADYDGIYLDWVSHPTRWRLGWRGRAHLFSTPVDAMTAVLLLTAVDGLEAGR